MRTRSEVTVVAEDPSLGGGKLKHIGGSKSDTFNNVLANQVLQGLWLAHSDEKGRDKLLSASVAALAGIGPRDEVEGMLAAQMVAAHNAAMECHRRCRTVGAGCTAAPRRVRREARRTAITRPDASPARPLRRAVSSRVGSGRWASLPATSSDLQVQRVYRAPTVAADGLPTAALVAQFCLARSASCVGFTRPTRPWRAARKTWRAIPGAGRNCLLLNL